MLLQLQKPGLRCAASAFDWRECFGRAIKDGARPLLIFWPFGPVATVYDVQDTKGKKLPDEVNCFVAQGKVDSAMLHGFGKRPAVRRIHCEEFDGGDGNCVMAAPHESRGVRRQRRTAALPLARRTFQHRLSSESAGYGVQPLRERPGLAEATDLAAAADASIT